MLCSPLSRLKMLASMSNLVNSPQRSRTSDFPCATITWLVPIQIVSQSVDDALDVQAGKMRDAAQIPQTHLSLMSWPVRITVTSISL